MITNNIIENAREGSAAGWPLVLYFHHIHPHLDHYTSLNPDIFSKGLEIVLSKFNKIIAPNDLNGSVTSWEVPKEPSVFITFDDGYKDTLDFALPVLDKFGIKALFFIITGSIGKYSNNKDPRREFLSWDDIHYLHSMGHGIGAHTVTHKPLNKLKKNEAQHEVSNSIKELKGKLDTNIVHFSYPYGITHKQDIKFSSQTLSFGTVKASAQPWDKHPINIRRTYLPTGYSQVWEQLAEGWKAQWYG